MGFDFLKVFLIFELYSHNLEQKSQVEFFGIAEYRLQTQNA